MNLWFQVLCDKDEVQRARHSLKSERRINIGVFKPYYWAVQSGTNIRFTFT